MADECTHKRIAVSNEMTMGRLLDPNVTGGVASPSDHPWIVIMAYYSVYHLVEEIAAITDPNIHMADHDEQVVFLRKIPVLRDVVVLYNNLNSLRKYALYRPLANVSFRTEQQILGYANVDLFQSVVLGDCFGTIKDKLAAYRRSLLSVKAS